MDWRIDLMKRCKEKNIEISQEGPMVTFFCPKEPTEADKLEIVGPIPVKTLSVLNVEFVASWKPSSSTKIETISKMSGVVLSVENKMKDKTVVCRGTILPQMGGDPEKIFTEISDTIMEDGWADAWEITIGDDCRTFNRKVIETLTSHNITREFSFTPDEILNLRIDLENCQTIDDFINKM